MESQHYWLIKIKGLKKEFSFWGSTEDECKGAMLLRGASLDCIESIEPDMKKTQSLEAHHRRKRLRGRVIRAMDRVLIILTMLALVSLFVLWILYKTLPNHKF